MSSSTSPPQQSSTEPTQPTDTNTLFTRAIQTLPKDKPVVFVNLLRFRPQATYPSSLPASILSSSFSDPIPDTSPCSGQEAYFTRYFLSYHAAARDVYGEDTDAVQRVLYKGAPLMPLKFADGPGGRRTDEKYWHAVVMTRCQGWEVVQRISTAERYVTVGKLHREAAVEDDELFVSCAVEGFEFAA